MRLTLFSLLVPAVLGLLVGAQSARAADHDDTPTLKNLPRHEARLTDLHVFTRDGRLVISLCTNPAIPTGVASYRFPSDLTLRFHIDNHSLVSFADDAAVATDGGTILSPEAVAPDVTFEIGFNPNGQPRMKITGLRGTRRDVQVFTGLRDDPFIRGPRIGRNVAAVVLEMPLAAVLGSSSTLLVWATSKVPDVSGAITEHAGRALRSQFAENMALNNMRPREHYTVMNQRPDVVIFDTTHPAAFPNGRALTDDVVDAVGDTRVTGTDAPFPSANDVPFLDAFPYLAPPQ